MLKRIGALTLLIAAITTACSSSDEQPAAVAGSSESTISDAASAEAFCMEYASLQGERPESYVGSPEQVADADGLLAVAPAAVAADLAALRDYLASGAIDSDADPDSNLIENWPDDVQTAIANTEAFVAENC
jgi:hypothetical protein